MDRLGLRLTAKAADMRSAALVLTLGNPGGVCGMLGPLRNWEEKSVQGKVATARQKGRLRGHSRAEATQKRQGGMGS